ncbi:MAG: zinc-ribbon domain-containing protein [Oscillospiraceae bacterium]|nr:zinc-ribbon domain-containing protein [Oscillospiraceae bacterium]
MAVCPNCGAQLKDGEKFCLECGKAVSQMDEKAPDVKKYNKSAENAKKKSASSGSKKPASSSKPAAGAKPAANSKPESSARPAATAKAAADGTKKDAKPEEKGPVTISIQRPDDLKAFKPTKEAVQPRRTYHEKDPVEVKYESKPRPAKRPVHNKDTDSSAAAPLPSLPTGPEEYNINLPKAPNPQHNSEFEMKSISLTKGTAVKPDTEPAAPPPVQEVKPVTKESGKKSVIAWVILIAVLILIVFLVMRPMFAAPASVAPPAPVDTVTAETQTEATTQSTAENTSRKSETSTSKSKESDEDSPEDHPDESEVFFDKCNVSLKFDHKQSVGDSMILEYDMTKEGNFALVSMTGKSVMSLKYKTAVSSNSKESPVVLRLFSGNISVDMPPASDDGEKAYFPSAYIYGMLRSGGAEDGYDSTDRLEVYSTGIPLDVSEIVITECEVGPGEGYDTVSV